MKSLILYFFAIIAVIFFLSLNFNAHADSALVASYSFNENSGSVVNDSSGNNNNGSVSSATWDLSGKYGSALSFNGTNSMASVNDSSSLDLTTGMTLEAWVKPTALSSWRSILVKERPNHLTYALYANTDNSRPSGEIYVNGSNTDTRGTSQLTLNIWTHVAVTFDGSNLKIFINGVQASAKPLSGAIAISSNSLRIGGNTIWGEYFNGLIDEVRIYNRALTSSEIEIDMNTAIEPSPTGSPTPTPTPTLTPTPTPTPAEDQVGRWEPLMNWPLVAVHAVLLNTGKLLMWDGWEEPSFARVWDPAANTFLAVTNQSGLFCSGHSTLPDGRILVAGGHEENGEGGFDGIQDTNIFNPIDNTWASASAMFQPRWYPSVTTLNDGKAVAISGSGNALIPHADTPEVYNPSNNTWTQLSSVNTSDFHDPMYPHPYILPDGTLYVISPTFGLVRKLDVNNQTWIPQSPSPIKFGANVMYEIGKFMVSGGGATESAQAEKTTAIIDMNSPTPSWTLTSQMVYPRYHHNLVVLPDGKVLAVGGAKFIDKMAFEGTLPAELWDPATATWSTMDLMTDKRMYHSVALLMPDGRVLSAGGGRFGIATNYFSAQYYKPPYLFKGPLPTITGITNPIQYNSTMTIDTPDANDIATVSLISLASVTHTIDMDQRFLKLEFSKNAASLTVNTPINSNIAPAGYYMVFILNSNGVPSVAKIIQMEGESGPSPTPTPTPTPSPTPTPTVQPSSNLVASYSFNENTGSAVNDSSGNNNNGSISNAAWNSSGKYGSALSFNGTNSIVSVNDSSSLDLTTGMTLEAWVRPTTLTSWRSIIVKERPNHLVYALYANTDTARPSGEIYANGVNIDTRGTSQLTLATWTHIAVTFDGVSLKIFINGTQASTKAVSGAIGISSNSLRIGGNTIWGEYFNGLIDEIRIYNRALTLLEIENDKNTPL